MTSDPAPWRVIEQPSDPPAGAVGADARAEDGGFGRLVLPLAVGAATGLAVVTLGFALIGSGSGEPGLEVAAGLGESGQPVSVEVAEPTSSSLVVAVAGAVQRPGVVDLPPGSRVGDAIAAAGGYGPSVDAARAAIELNLAAPLVDGQQIVVPARGDGSASDVGSGAGSGSGAGGGDGSAAGPVDLNRATAEQLDSLPGVGPATIAKIMAAREERPFASLDELVERKVLGPATLEKIRDLAVVR